MAAQQRKLQIVLDHISEGYMSLDCDWGYRTVNRVAELFLGHAREDLTGKVWTEAFPAARNSAAETQLRRVMDHGVPVRFEWASVIHPDRRLEVQAFPLPLPEGGIGIVFGNLGGRETFLGWTADEIIGTPVGHISSPAALEAGAPWNEMARARRDGRASLQTEHLAKDGSPRALHDTVVPLADGSRAFLKLLTAPEPIGDLDDVR